MVGQRESDLTASTVWGWRLGRACVFRSSSAVSGSLEVRTVCFCFSFRCREVTSQSFLGGFNDLLKGREGKREGTGRITIAFLLLIS